MSEPSLIEEIFLAALKKSTTAERAAFLEGACKDNPDLRGQVERLLDAHPKADKFLEPAVRPEDAMAATYVPVSERSGMVIAGRYKLIENIGEGGMGSVWVAEQQQPVKRKVAVKLIKAGMDSKQVLARFEAERQALAVMDHPNIAKVFDGGLTDQGRPFFVMEYVKGVPFTEYCDKARLSLRERLTLFISVCQAVQHAHQKGIVHRDLKPSNILICLYDGKPVPKVIDFGLAKAMHQSLTDQSIYTGHGVMVGTPLYMSPEQAEHNNLDVDTRTDIYSLGVVLYELLVGTTPLERLQLQQAAFAEVLRLIKEVEPPRPSLRLSSSASLASIAAQRSIDPRHLSRSVAGDLDWIVMKTLEKERSRRYETATGLARDIERFLNDEAVEACPPSRAYRLEKLLRKHRRAVAAGSAILFALVIGIFGTALGLIRATRAEHAASAAERQALSSEQKALVALEQVTTERDGKEIETKRAEAAAESLEKYASVLQASLEEWYAEHNLKHGPGESHGNSTSELELTEGYRLFVRFKDHAIVEKKSTFRESANLDKARQQVAEYYAESFRTIWKENVDARERVERQLAQGILRPIGFKSETLDDAELQSLNDWFKFNDSRLQLQVLDVAFEDPATALRIARRAERVIQVSVGISPARRKQALELFAAKQRDETADPGIRVAACWFAMELGSEDVPALPESIQYLANASSETFAEFLQVAVARPEPDLRKTVVQVVPDALFSVIKTSTNEAVLVAAMNSIAALAPTFDSDQLVHSWTVLTRLLDRSCVESELMTSEISDANGDAVAAVAMRLPLEQRVPGWDRLVTILKNAKTPEPERGKSGAITPQAPSAVAAGLVVLARRIESSDVTRAWNSLIEVLKTSTEFNDLEATSHSLLALAPRLEQQQVTPAWKTLVAFLQKPDIDNVPEGIMKSLAVLAPRIVTADVSSEWDQLFAIMEEKNRLQSNEPFVILASRIESVKVPDAWDRVVGFSESKANHRMVKDLGRSLSAMAPHIADPDIDRCWHRLMATTESSLNGRDVRVVRDGVVALAPRVKPVDITTAWQTTLASLQRVEDSDNFFSGDDFSPLPEIVVTLILCMNPPGDGPQEVSLRFEAEQAKRLSRDLLQIMTTRTAWKDGSARDTGTKGLVALSSRMEPQQSCDMVSELIALMDESQDERLLHTVVEILSTLTPPLDTVQVDKTYNVLIAKIENRASGSQLVGGAELLVKLAPRLDVARVSRAFDAILRVFHLSVQLRDDGGLWNPFYHGSLDHFLVLLAPRLGETQITSACETLIAALQNSSSEPLFIAAGNGLTGLGDRLDRMQIQRSCDALLSVLKKEFEMQSFSPRTTSIQLSSMTRHLDASDQDGFACDALRLYFDAINRSPAIALNEQWEFIDEALFDEEETRWGPFTSILGGLSNPKSAAQWFSHPGCIGQPRDLLLLRFEELIFHDGNHVLLPIPEFASGSHSAASGGPQPDSPTRQFHNQYEAAAWIQKNWPDFDLESSVPTTLPHAP